MQRYEYKVVPSPARGEKARGLKTTGERFAHALTLLMNEMARDGWEYLRADTLPCEERTGLTSRSTTYQNLLVFRRVAAETAALDLPKALAPPVERPADPPVPQAAAATPRPEVAAPVSQDRVSQDRLPAEAPDAAAPRPAPELSVNAPLGEAPRLDSAPEAGRAPKLGPAD
nr:DUF4177 domain-containing protein [Frigidibacter oleivorans]